MDQIANTKCIVRIVLESWLVGKSPMNGRPLFKLIHVKKKTLSNSHHSSKYYILINRNQYIEGPDSLYISDEVKISLKARKQKETF